MRICLKYKKLIFVTKFIVNLVTMEDCNICCEKYTMKIKKKTGCPYCEFHCCTGCFRRYLLDNGKDNPDCMSCHRELNIDFIMEVTPKTFYNKEYREKKANDLLSREKSLLPETQNIMEERIAYQKKMELVNVLKAEERQLKERLKNIKREIFTIRHSNIDIFMENKNKEERKKFIKACPVNNCRGFLSQAWKCGICSVNVCSKCHEIKEDNHICDENTVATAKLLANDSKPCPKCASLIYKIEGCDQMFCTSCHTPFSWKTGKIVSGIIHNPHFYQWQREQNGGIAPRVPGDNPCGYNIYEIPYTYMIRQKLRNENKTCPNWEESHRLIGHIIGIELRRYPNIMGIQDNTDLRINFLSNKIDEKAFLRTLKLRQKKTEKNRAIHQILELFYISAIDIFKTYMNNTLSHIETPLFELKKYANNELDKVKNKYSGKIPYISDTWQIKTK